MLRVTTLYGSSASASAKYYTQYLTNAIGEQPGVWSGTQADAHGLHGVVTADVLQLVLEGRDPRTGTPLGSPLADRTLADGRVIRAVAGFDATFSAPKSVSVLWALAGDARILQVHDDAVRVALAHLERFGATTRLRSSGGRVHPDTGGLTLATFRQSTSRADDPQVHTHAVISTKVRTADGRWWALDARFLKKHQRMLGGLYQSALRAGMIERFGVGWGPVVNGQADIAGIPTDLLAVLSKRAVQVDDALTMKLDVFREREGREPSRWERAAMTREAAVDTRSVKSKVGVVDLTTRWRDEAAALGWTGRQLMDAIAVTARDHQPDATLTVRDVLDRLSAAGSTWGRADVMRTICDLQPARAMTASRWAAVVERATERVLATCVNLDPYGPHLRVRHGDGRSVWIEPVATQYSSDAILTQEEHVLAWALDRHADDACPSPTVECDGLDLAQADAAAAVAGHDRLVIIEGPAGTGKTTMLARAVDDLADQGRVVFGVAPTAKAARVLEGETRMPTDTVAKLLYEHTRPDREPDERYRLPSDTTLVVDEAGMVGTTTFEQLAMLADRHDWRVVLVGDPRQLQAVGRGGLFTELCATGRVCELDVVHRFTQRLGEDRVPEIAHGDLDVLDVYNDHDRVNAGSLDDHLEHVARAWVEHHQPGRSVAVTATTNEHVDTLNAAIQGARVAAGQIQPGGAVAIGGGEVACVGELVVTRRNDRTLTTTTRDMVRNRDRWIVTATHPDGRLTVSRYQGHGQITLSADYAREHVRLGYAATEHGNQGDTVDVAYQLISPATSRRGLYVGATRGRDRNQFLVISDGPEQARELLEQVLLSDRADVPAVAQRRGLATALPNVAPPSVPIPVHVDGVDWLAPLRQRLERQQAQGHERVAEYEHRRQAALAELAEVTPLLDDARRAWLPFQAEIDRLNQRLPGLYPAQSRGLDAVRDARFGQRRKAQEALDQAQAAIRDVKDQIAAVEHAGAHVKARIGELQDRSRPLHEQTRPAIIERWDIDHIHDIDRLIDAIDTWTDWNTGRAVSHDALIESIETLHTAARHAPIIAFDDAK